MDQSQVKTKVESILQTILAEKGIERQSFQPDETLYEDGLGLDSLDTATFSVHLENEFGTDPYSAEQFPQTINEVITYYATSDG